MLLYCGDCACEFNLTRRLSHAEKPEAEFTKAALPKSEK